MFGPRAADVDRVRSMGIAAFVDEQLHPERLPDEAAGRRLEDLQALTISPRAFATDYYQPMTTARQELTATQKASSGPGQLPALRVDGGYTQRDVVEVARCFTGWTMGNPHDGRGFVFKAAMHDRGEKRVLGYRIKAGRGIEDGQQVLDILARHPSTAKFMATKLARRFVADDPPQSLVNRAARTFRRTDGDLREVMRAILTSRELNHLNAAAVDRAAAEENARQVFPDVAIDGPSPAVRIAALIGSPAFQRR